MTDTYQPGDRVRFDDMRGIVTERIPSNRQGSYDYKVCWDDDTDGGDSIVWGSDLAPEDDVTWIRINNQVIAEVRFNRAEYGMQGTDEIPGRLTGAVRMMRAAVDEGMFGLTADATSEGS